MYIIVNLYSSLQADKLNLEQLFEARIKELEGLKTVRDQLTKTTTELSSLQNSQQVSFSFKMFDIDHTIIVYIG